MRKHLYNRRQAIMRAAKVALACPAVVIGLRGAQADSQSASEVGAVEGDPIAAKEVGNSVLKAGGNAIDACVATALVAGVVAPQQCGIGGYGGHMTIALADTKEVTSIDFNSMAPAAARPDMYPIQKNGTVRGNVHYHGWLAAGVPGTMAGLQRVLDLYGTRSFGELVQPAIRFARDGFVVGAGLAGAIRRAVPQVARDPASSRLFLRDGQPLDASAIYRNPELAELLQTLAKRNSVDSFYRGDIAKEIAKGFSAGGGLVTAEDMAAYCAKEVAPLALSWRGFTIHTAPLTAGGTTTLEALSILKALGSIREPSDPAQTHSRLEILRVAWEDRLSLFGDPQHVDVPVDRLLSEEYASDVASQVGRAVQTRKSLSIVANQRPQGGTVHFRAADRHGNMVALTMTHGAGFGARVTVPGLGLILGHGMSRFDPRHDHPNSPGPGKRPLHNMCPTIVSNDGNAVLALGGCGGRKIPNAVFEMLAQYVGRDASMAEAVAAPRLHTEGTLTATLDAPAPDSQLSYLQQIGYQIRRGNSAVVSAVSFDASTGRCRGVSR